MTLLSQVTKGKIKQPQLVLVYGVDGPGKSTFGAEAPDPLFIGAERGTANLNVSRLSIASFSDATKAIEELTKEKHDYKSLVIDSLDWLETLLWEQVCVDNNWKNIEDAGYGKGYVVANGYWKRMMGMLQALRDAKGMNIILIAHAHVKLAKDPQTQSEYDRYQLKLNDKASALWREYVDCVLFFNFETLTSKDKQGKVRAFGEGTRFVYTERRPGFDAKNRFGLPFQIEMIKGQMWTDFTNLVNESTSENPEVIVERIMSLLEGVDDQKIRDNVLTKVQAANGDAVALDKLQTRLREYVNVA